ncbi:MAG: ATPase domain-containing protein [Longimicrobiales bacterium]|nr:ATPase domain-containing protein [Longimicrobiales bacterium]
MKLSEPTAQTPEISPDGPRIEPGRVSTGVPLLDERSGGLLDGGSYLVVGRPGPAKLVTALHFLHEGLLLGEPGLLVVAGDPRGIVDAARGWGLPLDDFWHAGLLRILGFREDFELRAARTLDAEEVTTELEREGGEGVRRVVVDPGSAFLSPAGRTALGGAYLRWAIEHPATVLTTFAVDGDAAAVPSAAEWMLNAVSGRLVVEPRPGGLHQVTVLPTSPLPDDQIEAVSLELAPGEGLIRPRAFPSRRGGDRGNVDPDQLLVVALDGPNPELASWAGSAFRTEVVTEALDAADRVQSGRPFGAVLVYASRALVGDALKTVRALRPLTRAALVFAADDEVRASDRIALLEAGADDSLSGGVDFRELGLRIRQAIAAGSRPLPTPHVPHPNGTGVPGGVAIPGGAMPLSDFVEEVSLRMASPELGVFSLLSVPAPPDMEMDAETVLAGSLRDEAGDLITRGRGRIHVLLQGARRTQAEAFLARVRNRLPRSTDASGAEPRTEVLANPAHGPELGRLLEVLRGGDG